MTMGDRIVVMNVGQIQQIGAPLELYEQPANRFVAGFIGSPAMNMIEGTVRDRVFYARSGGFELPVGNRKVAGDVVLGVRPEDIYAADGPYVPESISTVQARVDVVEPMGNEIYLYASASGHELVARLVPQRVPRPDEQLPLAVDWSRAHFFDAGTGLRR